MAFRTRILILVLVAAAFGSTLTSPFHFDDYALFADPAVTSLSGWWEVFRLEQTRSLTYLTFWINYQLGGESAVAYHGVNLLLHMAACWLVSSLFARAAPNSQSALYATVVFALHPLQTEAIAYVFARATLLCTLLCLLCWKAWIEDRRGWATAWFALALLAKEEVAAFPLFLAGYEYVVRERGTRGFQQTLRPLTAMLGLVACAAARLFYAASITEGSGFAFNLGEITPITYFLTQGRVIWDYLRLIVLPIGLNFDRDIALSTGFGAAAALGWLCLGAAGAVAWFATQRNRHAYWFLGGLLLLAPTSSFVPLADLMAERRMYLPMVAFALLVGTLLGRGADSTSPVRKYAPLALGLLLTIVSFERSLIWRSEESLWRDTVAKSPAKARPKLQLARALAGRGAQSAPERFELLQTARELSPAGTDATLELGVFHLQTGNPREALAEFDRAATIEPENAQIEANRGAALYLLGRPADAEAAFRRALDLDPCNFDARHNLILLYRTPDSPQAARDTAEPPPDCRWTPKQAAALRAGG